jgi:3-oxoacyl-(acyl-carrier-protein) synthase
MGIVSPLGLGSKANWQAILANANGISKLDMSKFEGSKCSVGGPLSE